MKVALSVLQFFHAECLLNLFSDEWNLKGKAILDARARILKRAKEMAIFLVLTPQF